MRAIVITEAGGPEVLELREVEAPVPARGEVRLRVRGTAVNRADLLQRRGGYPSPAGWPQDIPGLEVAGEVVERGPGAERFAVGDRVYGIVGGGGYAEELCTREDCLAPIPEGLDTLEAAAVPEAFITAADALYEQAGLAPGERLLVNAAASGVGLAALQLARVVGALALGSTRSGAKQSVIHALGAQPVLVEDGALAEAVLALGPPVDVVLELVGGPYLAEDLRCLRTRGRIVLVGLMAGRRQELDLGALLVKRVQLRGTVLRSRPLDEKIAAHRLLERLGPLFEAGALRPVVDRVLPLEQAAAAHALLEENATAGKVILEL